MKKLALALLAATFLTSAAFADAETYTLDPNHTNIVWYANHFGFSNPSGRFGIKEGTLVLDEKAPAKSHLEVTIDVAGLTTGIPKFDEHILSKDFLDAATYPTATFISNKVVLTSKTSAKVTGAFTLHGVTKPATLNVKLNKIGVSPMSQIKTSGFTATLTIKRSDYGISAYVPNISDEISIRIESEANLKAGPTAEAQ